jgi:lambda family phage portal protein
MGFIKSDTEYSPDDITEEGQRQIALEPGVIEQLRPGEDFVSFNPSRPNTGMDPFMRYMLREVAAGVGVSYESLSRDHSQSNYSSSRLSLIEDRDIWKTLQQWFIRSFRMRLHKMWMERAVLSGAIPGLPIEQYVFNTQKFNAVKFKPRGWSWVDPTKEIAAYKEAIKGGLTTLSDVIAQTANGDDLEDVLTRRKEELDMCEELGLYFDTEAEEPPEIIPDAPAQQPIDSGDSTDA